MPIDGENIWPVLTGATPGVRDELLIGIGSGQGTKGALVSGGYKLISPGGNSLAADGWSAQYPGSTPAIAPLPDSSCKSRPCLFNLQEDPRETKDLVLEEPDRAAAMLRRYQELARAKYAPNGDEGEGLDVDCDHDECWRSGRRWSESECEGECEGECEIDGKWYDGAQIVFAMKKLPHNQVDMTIVSGCEHCAFTEATGTISTDGKTIEVVAFGKGERVSHGGEVYYDSSAGLCRIHWTSQNRTHGGQWGDFCRGHACPTAPPHKHAACEKMLQDGYWQPYT